MKIPASPEMLTKEWLTNALRTNGILKNERVASFEMKPFEETGTGNLSRLLLSYNSDAEPPLHSIIAKFSSADPGIRADNHALNLYGREVEFYRNIADQVELRIPRCYYSDIDFNTGACVLLLEDLTAARSLDKFATCTLAEAELIVEQIARFHATWWEHPTLEEMGWLSAANDIFYQKLQARYQQSWEPFLEKMGDTLPDEILTLGERLNQYGLSFWHHLHKPPQTIIHFDYHLGNLLFLTDREDENSLAVIDWQLTRLGRGVYDVALFLGRNVTPADRKSQEMTFLRMYHTILVESGIEAYSFDQCQHDYRLYALSNLIRTVLFVGGGIKAPSPEAYETVLPRCSAAILDLNSAELLLE